MKVLIAEDENVSRRMLQKTLEKWGYEVVSTANGVEALSAFQQNDFSMVITDWMMPEMDGVQLVEKIRNTNNRDYVYIIMLTANSKKEDLV
nr:response regulator [Nitrospirales bacterium]